MKDPRDPRELGATLLKRASAVREAYGLGVPLHEVWDFHAQHIQYPDYPDESTVDKYGDPVAAHRERIAAGLEVELP